MTVTVPVPPVSTVSLRFFTSKVPVDVLSEPPVAWKIFKSLSRKMPPVSVFVPLPFCELTVSRPEVLPLTVLMVLEKFTPPVAGEMSRVPPAPRL